MTDWFAGRVGQKVLLGDIGDIGALGVLGEQVVERLILVRTHFGGDRLIPFICVVEFRIVVEHDPAEREDAVADHRSDGKFGGAKLHRGSQRSATMRRAPEPDGERLFTSRTLRGAVTWITSLLNPDTAPPCRDPWRPRDRPDPRPPWAASPVRRPSSFRPSVQPPAPPRVRP